VSPFRRTMRHKKWTEGSRGLTNHAVSGLAWCLQHRGRCGLRSCQCGGTTANVEADVARAKKKKVIFADRRDPSTPVPRYSTATDSGPMNSV